MPAAHRLPSDAILQSVATQLMSNDAVTVESRMSEVSRSSRSKLRMVSFEVAGQNFQAIEQNPDKPSRWGQLARDGHQVVQFKDTATNRFIAVVVDGKVIGYSRS